MFKRILIANRGEIALRILRACREMGIETVAIFSEADRGAAYLDLANEAYCVGPAEGRRQLSEDRPRDQRRRDRQRAGDSSGLWLPGRESAFRRDLPQLRDRVHRAHARGDGVGGRQERRPPNGQGGRRSHRARQRGPGRGRGAGGRIGPPAWFSGADQGVGGRRRPRDARGPERSVAEVGHPAGPGRGRGRLRQRRNLSRKIRRASPPRRGAGDRRQSRQRGPPLGARLLDAAAAPETGRGKSRPAARSANPRRDVRGGGPPGPGRQLHQRRHGRVHRRSRGQLTTSSR